MHFKTVKKLQHDHYYHVTSRHGERNTHRVILLTVVMMVIEIAAGFFYGSMALLADGWHMGTHAVALGITAFAYYYARKHSDNPKFSFGTGKVGILGGFASAIVLGVVAMLMVVESVERLLSPVTIHFNEAILVAVIGLVVNIVSAFILGDHHEHDHAHEEHHQDQNLRAAYLHVIADALTSLLAIVALVAGKGLGWVWLDPAMGIVGAVLISRWSYGLIKDTSKILLDTATSSKTTSEMLEVIEADSDNIVSDFHIWRVSERHYAAIISIVTHSPKPPGYYKDLLSGFEELEHVTIEVNKCESEPCIATHKKKSSPME